MIAWAETINQRANLLHSEIAAWQIRSKDLGIDPLIACAPFYELLNQIYTEDLPLAKAKDDSDLLLHIEGSAVLNSPRISVVSNIFNQMKEQVRDLSKAVVGIRQDTKISIREIDLGLSGMARGSLFIGFNVPLPPEKLGHRDILGEHDSIFKATKDALRIINMVSHSLEIGDANEITRHVAQVVEDPKIRDAALVAVRRIAPSGRQGVEKIGITSSSDTRKPAELNAELRYQISKMLLSPVISKETIELKGTIRGIDLDAKRFELRGISDHKIQDIRCIYGEMDNIDPKTLLDQQVKVRGKIERRADEAPRLMQIENIDVENTDPEPVLF